MKPCFVEVGLPLDPTLHQPQQQRSNQVIGSHSSKADALSIFPFQIINVYSRAMGLVDDPINRSTERLDLWPEHERNKRAPGSL
jgi:hypothetical protein